MWRAVSHHGGLAGGGDGGVDRWRCSWRQSKDTTSKDKRPPQENQFSQRTYFPRFPLLLNTTHYRDPPRAQRRRRRRGRETAAKETFPPRRRPNLESQHRNPRSQSQNPTPGKHRPPLLPKTNQSRSAKPEGREGRAGPNKIAAGMPPTVAESTGAEEGPYSVHRKRGRGRSAGGTERQTEAASQSHASPSSSPSLPLSPCGERSPGRIPPFKRRSAGKTTVE